MSLALFVSPKWSFQDDNGGNASGWKLYTYEPGTSTPKAAYQDSAGTTPHANPIVLDARGEAEIWLDGAYKFVLKNAAGVTKWTADNVSGYGSGIQTGYLVKDVAGSANVALTASEQANAVIEFTGELTGNINVTVGDDKDGYRWVLKNSTTGAYTLTFRTTSGTGVAIARGSTITVLADSANIVATDASEKIASIAVLRTVTPINGHRIYLKAHTTEGDGGHGFFRGVTGAAAGTYTDNGGTIIVPTGGDGSAAWVRDYSGSINLAWFGLTGASTGSGDTAAIQNCIDVAAVAGADVVAPPGVWHATRIQWKSGVYMRGAGFYVTTLKQISGTNADFIWSDGDIQDFGIESLDINGNYFTSDWNAAAGTTGNTSGAGLKLKANGCRIDVVVNNVAGIGAHFQELDSPPASPEMNFGNRVSIEGEDFGKEGLLIEGPNDWVLEHAFIGRAGILPRPSAETTVATSDAYPGEPVDGIVLDGVNLEFGRIHVYGCWSGRGFRTRNTVRLEGEHLISESNNGQVDLSSGTYGEVALISVRNLSLIHPNWSAATPSYTSPDSRWDAVTCAATGFNCPSLKIHRTITAITRVPGTNGLVLSGNACHVGFSFNNSSPTNASDAEFGGRYSGGVALISGNNNAVNGAARNPRGDGVLVSGNQNLVNVTVASPQKYGVQATGNQNTITAICNSQAQDGGAGAAFNNAGNLNTWNTTGTGNAVPYESATGLNGIAGSSMNSTLRTFTIASGAITVTTFDKTISVDTEGGAATDDLDTIVGGARWQRLTIKAANSERDVVVKDDTGNLRTAGDFTLTHGQDVIELEYDGTNWVEITRSDNSV